MHRPAAEHMCFLPLLLMTVSDLAVVVSSHLEYLLRLAPPLDPVLLAFHFWLRLLLLRKIRQHIPQGSPPFCFVSSSISLFFFSPFGFSRLGRVSRRRGRGVSVQR